MFLRHKKAIETCSDEKKDERCRDLTIKVNVVSVDVATQGAGRPFDLPKKLPMSETHVFGFGTTWGTNVY